MSRERIKISPDLYDIMPSDYQDLVSSATYGKEDRGWKDIGTSKELIEQHSLCVSGHPIIPRCGHRILPTS
jgi:pyruvate ferredoxin oxidoreductase beta subunit